MDDEEWLPEEEIRKRAKAEKALLRDSDEYYESSEDDDMPPGYQDAHQYNSELLKLRPDLTTYGDYFWVKPYQGGIAIWFKSQHVNDTKWEKLNGRQESKNEGDYGWTWHHTDVFEGGKCFLQQVPLKVHCRVAHIGGVALQK
jgi:hypothetical protein